MVGLETQWIAAAMLARPEIQAKQWALAALGDDAALAGLWVLDGTSVGRYI